MRGSTPRSTARLTEFHWARPPFPVGMRYFADYVAGVPLLESETASIDLAPVERALALVAGSWHRPLPDVLRKETEALEAELRPRPIRLSHALRTEAIPQLETALPVSISGRRYLRRVASGGALAPPLLLGLRVAAGHGPVDWHRSRQHADARLWMLRQSVALPADRMSVLSKRGRSSSCRDSRRRSGRSAD